MREEFVEDLVEGMVTANSIYTQEGLLVVPKGITLTGPIIRHLVALNVFSIKVEDELRQPGAESAVYEETMEFLAFKEAYAESKDKLNDAFSQVLDRKMKKEDVRKLVDDSWATCHKATNSYDTINMLYSMHSYSDSTYMHSMNVGIIASLIGKWLGWSEEEQRLLHTAGLFHDVGKLTIPKKILDKPGKLTDEEYAIMKTHTVEGYNLIKDIGLAPAVVNAALMHHERCDGTGYPNGYNKDQIDKYSKIIAIADVYEAMTANRVYRSGMCPFDVIARIEEDGFSHFETEYLLIFLNNIVDSYLNSKVQLSNGEKAEVIMINRQKGSRPLVLTTSGRAIDLSKDINVKIESIISI